MLPNLKIALPMTPARARAPIITINSIWSEPDCLSDAGSAAAKVTAPTAGGGAAAEFDCRAGPELPVVGAGLADELTPDDSGQREVTTDGCVFASRAFAGWLFSTLAAFAVIAGLHCQVGTLVSCSTRVCGTGSSACAAAIDRCVAVSFRGETGFAVEAEFCGAARESFSRSSPMYQQWRLLARSTR
jgi:hypothetical protein